jgi:dTDP-4-dehydrorhamnose reductase
MDRILIVGAKGALGGQLRLLYPAALAWDREEADVRNFRDLEERVLALDPPPEAIVNCVAYNDVDGAEDHREAAVALNTIAPLNLAGLARQLEIPIVHFSTNYVFDGAAGEYAEDACPAPLSFYGKTKARGEAAVAMANPHHYIVRTSVIFGPKGESELSKKSFVDLMLELSAQRDSIQAVDDEVNSITYAPDLAAGAARLLEERRPYGVYHITNSGSASWFEFASEIFRLTGRATRLVPVPSTHFPRKARRPSKAVLRNTKLPPLRPWQEALEEFLRRSGALC